MKIRTLKLLKKAYQLNIKHYKQTIDLEAFIVDEQKLAMEDLIENNETAIEIIDQEIINSMEATIG